MKKNFVKFLFEYLESNINYLILRNYENLPDDEGHDIDLLININEIKKIEILLNQIRKEYDVSIFKNYRYNNLKSHLIVFENEILHLDFFTSVQWNQINLFETSSLLSKKGRFKNRYWVMNPLDFQKYCWFLFIVRKGNLKKEKYINSAFKYSSTLKFQKKLAIDIKNKNENINKLRLFLYFLCKHPTSFFFGTIKNIIFKINKLKKPYGRIFEPDSNLLTRDLCIKFCFIDSKEFTVPQKDYLAVPKMFFSLSNETGIIVSSEFLNKNPQVKFVLKRFFVKTTENLKESVNLTLNHEIHD